MGARGTSPEISTQEHRALAVWAAACAARVLHHFEAVFPDDTRPGDAIAACRKWARDGVFKMADVRRSALAAHAAARRADEGSAARFAARAAGQAVATAHVPSHALGALWYGLKAARAAGAPREAAWLRARLPVRLRPVACRLAGRRAPLLAMFEDPAPVPPPARAGGRKSARR